MPQTELRREREERHCVSGTLFWVVVMVMVMMMMVMMMVVVVVVVVVVIVPSVDT